MTDVNGCSATQTYTVGVNPGNISIDYTANITDASCIGGDGAINLTVNGGGEAPYSYRWSHGPTTKNLSNIVAGTYVVVISDRFGCNTTASFTVNATPGPAKPDLTQNGNELTSTAASAYQWYRNGVRLDGEVSQTLQVTESDNYSVMVFDGLGCSTSSDYYYAEVTSTINEEEIPGGSNSFVQALDVYPVPTQDYLNYDIKMRGPANVAVHIFDLKGERLHSEDLGVVGAFYKNYLDVHV